MIDKKYWLILLGVCLGFSIIAQSITTGLPAKYKHIYQAAGEQRQQGNLKAAKENYLAVIKYLKGAETDNKEWIADLYFDIAQLESNYLKQLEAVQAGIRAVSHNFYSRSVFNNPAINQVVLPKKALGLVNFKIHILYQYWKSTKGDDKYLSYALKTGHFADALITRIRQDLGADIAEKERQLPNFLMAYEQGIEIASDFFTITGESFYFDQAFYFAERNKSILLAEKTISTEGLTSDGKLRFSRVLLEEERFYKKDLADIEIDLALARQNKEDATIEALLPKQAVVKEKLTKFVQALRKTYPDYYEAEYNIDIPKIEEIQDFLDEETAIVEYAANDAISENIYGGKKRKLFVFTITQEELSITKIPWSQALNKELIAYHKQLKKVSIIRSQNFKKFTQTSWDFYKRLIAPINKYIGKSKKLIFILEAELNYLPFESLVVKRPLMAQKPAFSNLPFLLKYFDISYHYSTTLLFNSLKKKRTANKFLGFAPVFSMAKSMDLAKLALPISTDTTALTYQRGASFAPLQWSELEIKRVSELFEKEKVGNSEIVLRAEASKATLLKALEGQHDFIHIATHSFANLKYPILSGIICHPSKDIAKEEAILRMGEIYNLRIRANLVVLSSCESGFGELLGGEGILGLNRAFVFAGTPNVLYSLWKVNDKITAQFMVTFFYQILEKKATYAEALRRAKLKLLNTEESSLPLYWTAFQLVGQ